MTFFEKVKRDIMRDEGWRDKVYLCPAGRNTIGWGHNIDAKPLPPEIQAYLEDYGYIEKFQGEIVLSEDISDALTDCNRLFLNFPTFSENRRRALVNFMFNLGLARAKGFKKANEAIRQEDWKLAAKEMRDSKWYIQVGERAERICKLIEEG